MTNNRMTKLSAVIVCLAGALLAQLSSPSSAQSRAPATGASTDALKATKPTIVLVHGAFADGTGWQHVIKILERDGYNVIAVQNAPASFAGDVQTTKRVIDAQQGPVVAVGHSYGGAVITSAAAGNANVKALVYIAAFAPDVGEAIGAYGEKYPAALGAALKPDSAGFLYIDRARFHELFAADFGDRSQGDGGDAEADHRQCVRRVGGAGGVEDRAIMVPRYHRRSGPQSRAAAFLRQAHRRDDNRDQVKPRGVHIASGSSCSTDQTGRDRQGEVAPPIDTNVLASRLLIAMLVHGLVAFPPPTTAKALIMKLNQLLFAAIVASAIVVPSEIFAQDKRAAPQAVLIQVEPVHFLR